MGRRRQRMRRPRGGARGVGNTREREGGGYRGIRVCRTVWSECGESARTRYPVRRWRACGGIEGGEAAQARRRGMRDCARPVARRISRVVCVRRGICGKWRERCVTVEVARKTLCEAKLGPYRSRAPASHSRSAKYHARTLSRAAAFTLTTTRQPLQTFSASSKPPLAQAFSLSSPSSTCT